MFGFYCSMFFITYSAKYQDRKYLKISGTPIHKWQTYPGGNQGNNPINESQKKILWNKYNQRAEWFVNKKYSVVLDLYLIFSVRFTSNIFRWLL